MLPILRVQFWTFAMAGRLLKRGQQCIDDGHLFLTTMTVDTSDAAH